MSEQNFGVHNSKILIEAYKKKFWQGQNPQEAKIIFLGLDANWDAHIEDNTEIFEEVLEYLDDGVVYWKKNNIHHPFLLPTYKKGGGYKYHSVFAKTGITSKYADDISFVEILPVPTYGRSSSEQMKFDALLDFNYLQRLNDIIFDDSPRIVFIAKSVYNKIVLIKEKYKLCFFDLDKQLTPGTDYSNRLTCIHDRDNTFVYVHTHFSGNISNEHINQIGNVAILFLESQNK